DPTYGAAAGRGWPAANICRLGRVLHETQHRPAAGRWVSQKRSTQPTARPRGGDGLPPTSVGWVEFFTRPNIALPQDVGSRKSARPNLQRGPTAWRRELLCRRVL